MSESGMIKFFKDNDINPESYETLAISWHLNATEMGLIQKDEFEKGFSKSGCSDKRDIKKVISQICRSLSEKKQFRVFYKWIFHHAKEDDKKKTIGTDLGIQLWKIVLTKYKNKMKFFEDWLKYCDKEKDKNLKVISRDVWEQSFDFLLEFKDIKNYDSDTGAWPVAVDEFVEYLQAKNNVEQKKDY